MINIIDIICRNFHLIKIYVFYDVYHRHQAKTSSQKSISIVWPTRCEICCATTILNGWMFRHPFTMTLYRGKLWITWCNINQLCINERVMWTKCVLRVYLVVVSFYYSSWQQGKAKRNVGCYIKKNTKM
jgi:hypothetical protein